MTGGRHLVASASQTIGPFFHVGPGATDRFGRMAHPDAPGEHIGLHLRILDGDGAPVPDALIELRQADADGVYSSAPTSLAASPAFTGFGRLATDDEGRCMFETIRPGSVHDGSAERYASHINLCIFMRGMMRHLYTRLYFQDDPGLDNDPLLALVSADRRATLIARRRTGEPGSSPGTADWEFVIRLQGDGETVFFDV